MMQTEPTIQNNANGKSSAFQVGLITIGQSPRTDITGGFREILEPYGVKITESGVLDGLTFDQVRDQYWPRSTDSVETIYVSRMRDGTEVKLLKSLVQRGVQQRISELESACDLIVVLCTGTFKGLRSSVPLIFPDQVIKECIRELGLTERLHVIAPTAEQKPFLTAKWDTVVRNLTFSISSPYQRFNLVDVANEINASRPEGVVLDCMGYRKEHKETIFSFFHEGNRQINDSFSNKIVKGEVPIVLSQEVVADFVRNQVKKN